VPLAEPVGPGRLLEVDAIGVATGGIVSNTGIALGRLGLGVTAAGLVGDDLFGREVRSRLTAEGVGTDCLEAHPSLATSTTAVLIDPTGERSFAHHVGACGGIDLALVRRHLGAIGGHRFAVLGYVGLLPGLERDLGAAVAAIRAAGPLVVLETGGSGGTLADVLPALPHVDLYVPSLDEARHQTALSDPRAIIECYRGHGLAGIAGVKLGSRGTLLHAADGDWLEIPCIAAPGPVADTTGAGDSLLAGLVAGLARGMPLAEAGRLGAATAACCVTGVGATAGLRSLEETLRLAGLP
jgi:sugar/nucleoside kinase (ribokinase family)